MHLPLLGVIAVITMIYIALGSLMEALAMMLLTIPSSLRSSSRSVKTMLPDLSIRTIFRGTIPFPVANIVALVAVILVPGIALRLVGLMR
ncbi:hypothetical protein [Paraburkholderia sp. EG304]|uniref:hypothetical protein n=1 Tax=Paraburkholderia sp. EG304 TaxID=3237015 RepID=UPI00397A47B6